MIVGQEQLYFIRFLNNGKLHGGNASDTVPRLYQERTAIREAKKMNLRALDNAHILKTYGFVEVIPAHITIGAAIPGPHVINHT